MIVVSHQSLHLQRSWHSIGRRRKHSKELIANHWTHLAGMGTDDRLNDGSEHAKRVDSLNLVIRDQPAVAGHISVKCSSGSHPDKLAQRARTLKAWQQDLDGDCHADEYGQEVSHDALPRYPTLATKQLNAARYQSAPRQRDFDMCGLFGSCQGHAASIRREQ